MPPHKSVVASPRPHRGAPGRAGGLGGCPRCGGLYRSADLDASATTEAAVKAAREAVFAPRAVRTIHQRAPEAARCRHWGGALRQRKSRCVMTARMGTGGGGEWVANIPSFTRRLMY